MTEILPNLRRCSVPELEARFARPGSVEAPRGVYRGHFLAWLDHREARRWRWRWPQRVGFEWTPFGIDFDRGRWFFFGPSLRVGRFETTVGPSRWRDTTSVALRYEPSRLPRAIKRHLYDEVKPLEGSLVLGLGGVNLGRDLGDHFFFALEPIAGVGAQNSQGPSTPGA